MDVTRTSVVWLVCLIITWTGFRDWENTSVASIMFQLLGFLTMVVGNLTYQQIIQWPCLKEYQLRQQAEHESRTALLDSKSDNAISMQPNEEYSTEND